MLVPTPPDRLCDARGRPYFLWDCDLTLDAWRALTRDPDADVRAYWIGAAMRQAKPDDVLTLLTWPEIEGVWERLRLGKQAAFSQRNNFDPDALDAFRRNLIDRLLSDPA